MKAIRKHLKSIVLIIIVPFLIQSCTIYKKANSSLYDAANSKTKVKIIKKNGWKEKFYRVELLDDGHFYGKILYEDEKILLDRNTIQKVMIKDKKKSTLYSIAIPVLVLGVISGVVALGLSGEI